MRRAPFFLLLLTAASLIVFSTTDSSSETCTEGQNYAHEKYCDRYYQCENGTKHMKKCFGRWLFDAHAKKPKDRICKTPISVHDCSNRPYTNTSLKAFVGKQRPECKKGQPTRYYAHENYCNLYYKCENGTEELGQCPGAADFDDRVKPEELSCRIVYDSSRIDCSYRPLNNRKDISCPRKKKDYYFNDTNDCRALWHCYYKKASVQLCGDGKVYSGHSSICDYADLVNRTDLTCDLESILGIKCPQHFHINPGRWSPTYVKGGRYTDTGHLLQETILDLENPRISYPGGHCEYYYECILTENGTRRPRLRYCKYGLVYQPHTQLCVYRQVWPICWNYFAESEAKEKYRINLILDNY